VSATLALSINDFFDALQDKFLAAFAYVMGIPLGSIQVWDKKHGCKCVGANNGWGLSVGV